MTNKVYRTAQGKIVDLGALQLRNENVRAVGNMRVNARGDLVDSQNQPIDSKNQQVSRQYQKQTTNVQNQSTHAARGRSAAPKTARTQPAGTVSAPAQAPAEPQVESTVATDEPVSGLAAAIARARQVKQTTLEPPPSKSSTTGIKKI